MSKKISLNLFVYSLVLTLVLCACGREATEENFQNEIRYFILEHLEDEIEYTALSFQKIDNDFLSSDTELATSILAVQDSVKAKLHIALQYAIDFESDVMKKFLTAQNRFEVDLIDELIFENVRLDKAVKLGLNNKGLSLPEQYYNEQQVFSNAILDTNQRLQFFNLSAYHLDLNGDKSVYYLHQFRFGHNHNRSIVFELDTESLEVLSFKEIEAA